MYQFRDAGTFAAEQQGISGFELERNIGSGCLGRCQHKAATGFISRRLKCFPIEMPRQRGLLNLVHAGSFECAVGQVKAGRLDDVHTKAETGGGSDDRTGVAGNVRLEEGDAKVTEHEVAIAGALPSGNRLGRMAPDGMRSGLDHFAIREVGFMQRPTAT